MSRIGERKIILPQGVKASLEKNTLIVEGPKGSLKQDFSDLIEIILEDNKILTKHKNKIKEAKILQGTTNSLINNMVEGVFKGFSKNLEIVGVGYRFNVQGDKLTISAGFSKPKVVDIPEGLKVSLVNNTEIMIEGIDKHLVTEFAANIKKIRKPEPYKGKGIRYKDEHINRKEGKKAA